MNYEHILGTYHFVFEGFGLDDTIGSRLDVVRVVVGDLALLQRFWVYQDELDGGGVDRVFHLAVVVTVGCLVVGAVVAVGRVVGVVSVGASPVG